MRKLTYFLIALPVVLFFIISVIPDKGLTQPETQGTETEEQQNIGTTVINDTTQQSEKVSENELSLNDLETIAQKSDLPTVSMDFKDADIKDILRVLSYKSGVNIVAGDDVKGVVTVKLKDVPWDKALGVILKTYGYGYEVDDNVITIVPLIKLTEQKKNEKELESVEALVAEVFELKFLDAGDVKKAIEPQLTPRGRMTILYAKGQKGWDFGGGGSTADTEGGALTKRGRQLSDDDYKSRILIVSDIRSSVDNIRKIIESIDRMPFQVLIETKIVEVSKDKLRDLGIEWGTGSGGAESDALSSMYTPLSKKGGNSIASIGTHNISSQVTPSIFDPAADLSGVLPYDAGFTLVFKKLTGTQFEAILHALEENVGANTISAPKILTLDNQEASILIGQKYPITKSEISTETGQLVGASLEYYQDIGIQLNVVPQITSENFINMIIHPAVSSSTEEVTLQDEDGRVLAQYPIILTREAETQVLLKDGETIVIGGLLKNVESEGEYSIPFLGDIPILGELFKRKTKDIEQIDLIIFITAKIVEPGTISDIGYAQRIDISDITSGKYIKNKFPKEKKVALEPSDTMKSEAAIQNKKVIKKKNKGSIFTAD